MASLNVVFAGFGGQGILFSGKIVAYSGLIDGREVSWLPSYGPEMRGGTANCSVCLSDEPVGSPLVTEPDVLVAMNAPSYDKFIGTVVPRGKVFIDSTLIDRQCPRDDVTQFAVPATQLSIDRHFEGIANIILLGKVFQETSFTGMETLKKAFEKCIPQKKVHLLEPNMKAIELGMSL